MLELFKSKQLINMLIAAKTYIYQSHYYDRNCKEVKS